MSAVSAHPVRVKGRLDPQVSRWLKRKVTVPEGKSGISLEFPQRERDRAVGRQRQAFRPGFGKGCGVELRADGP